MASLESTVIDAVRNAQTLSIVSELESHSGTVLPPRRDKDYPYVVYSRDGEAVNAVILDGDASGKNRMEDAIRVHREAGDAHGDSVNKLNHIRVSYDTVVFTETDVPNRIANTHILAATDPATGKRGIDNKQINEAIFKGPKQAHALVTASPLSHLLGVWNSLVRNGIQHPSMLRTSTVGVLADQTRDRNGSFVPPKPTASGFRRDPVLGGAKGSVAGKTNRGIKTEIIADMRSALTEYGTDQTLAVDENGKPDTKRTPDKDKLSNVGLGSIGLGGEGGGGADMSVGVAVSEIRRTMAVSLALIRRLRYASAEDAQAVHAAFVSLAVYLDRLAAQDLHLRAGTDLYETESLLLVDGDRIPAPSLDQAQKLFESLYPAAAKVTKWNGSVIDLRGNTVIGQLKELQ